MGCGAIAEQEAVRRDADLALRQFLAQSETGDVSGGIAQTVAALGPGGLDGVAKMAVQTLGRVWSQGLGEDFQIAWGIEGDGFGFRRQALGHAGQHLAGA